MGLRILITNNTLDWRAGTELYVRDLAFGLLARGHHPIAYSTVLGDVARELRRGTVPVVDDLDAVGAPPDLIHGHHHLETTAASLRFPQAPVISFCHGWAPWEELPARLPTVARHVAVDEACRDRLVDECGLPASAVTVLYNFVDLRRFRPRGPLPARPRRALVFSNAAGERTQVPAIREACERRGIALDVAGLATSVLERPEETLGGYDLVFAKARAAMEAMATGCAVVLCDAAGAGPHVTPEAFETLRALNFGLRTLRHPLTPEHLGREIDRYDAAAAGRVRDLMRAAGDLERRLDELLALYTEVLGARRPPVDPGELSAAAARYLQTISPRVKGWERGRSELARLGAALEGARAEAQHARDAAQREAGDAGRREAELAAVAATLEREAAQLRREPGVRLQLWACGLPVLGPVVRAVGRRLFGSARP